MLFQELFSSCCVFWTGGLFIFSPSLNVPAASETTQCFCVCCGVRSIYRFFARPTQGYIQHPHSSLLSPPIMVCSHTSICFAFNSATSLTLEHLHELRSCFSIIPISQLRLCISLLQLSTTWNVLQSISRQDINYQETVQLDRMEAAAAAFR